MIAAPPTVVAICRAMQADDYDTAYATTTKPAPCSPPPASFCSTNGSWPPATWA
jgi:hypothetical protein